MLGASRAITKRVPALHSFGDEEAKTLRGRRRRSLRDTCEHSQISLPRCPASDGSEPTPPAPFPAPPPQQAGPSGERCGVMGEPACPGSGPVPSVSSLGPRPASPPPEAVPLDVSGAERAQGQGRTEPRLLGGRPGPTLESPAPPRPSACPASATALPGAAATSSGR